MSHRQAAQGFVGLDEAASGPASNEPRTVENTGTNQASTGIFATSPLPGIRIENVEVRVTESGGSSHIGVATTLGGALYVERTEIYVSGASTAQTGLSVLGHSTELTLVGCAVTATGANATAILLLDVLAQIDDCTVFGEEVAVRVTGYTTDSAAVGIRGSRMETADNPIFEIVGTASPVIP